ncbi:PREDICTED: zinc carboxypeptidase A 1-like, partial [Wasmannia auropunctata]|uniref:zinc carboxypeptidase A 1-like n=1 Tax=Wasmannia auropunctata TaxID=64793 RepID=UPI0005F027AF
DRLWKKTRKPSSPDCYGSDPDRNWGFRWNHTGVSNPCAEDYPGKSAFSEIEMMTMAHYISNLNFYAYVSFHGYGQRLGFPFSYTDSHSFINYEELYRVGTAAVVALKQVHGTTYYTGCLGEISPWGLASGSSIDYVAGALFKNVTFRYQMRDKLTFLLPPNQIIPTGEEIISSLINMFNKISNKQLYKQLNDCRNILKSYNCKSNFYYLILIFINFLILIFTITLCLYLF